MCPVSVTDPFAAPHSVSMSLLCLERSPSTGQCTHRSERVGEHEGRSSEEREGARAGGVNKWKVKVRGGKPEDRERKSERERETYNENAFAVSSGGLRTSTFWTRCHACVSVLCAPCSKNQD